MKNSLASWMRYLCQVEKEGRAIDNEVPSKIQADIRIALVAPGLVLQNKRC
ncbi:MAG: hypothetical protein ACTS85_01350 [Arsenophonus sp. NC-PG7-MAG3]